MKNLDTFFKIFSKFERELVGFGKEKSCDHCCWCFGHFKFFLIECGRESILILFLFSKYQIIVCLSVWTSWATTGISWVVKMVWLSLYKLFSKIWGYRNTTCLNIFNASKNLTNCVLSCEWQCFWSNMWLSHSCLFLREDVAFIYIAFHLYIIKKTPCH